MSFVVNVSLYFIVPLEFEWNFSQDLSAILVKQEEPDVGQRLDPPPLEGPPLVLSPPPTHRGSPWRHTVSIRHQTDCVPADANHLALTRLTWCSCVSVGAQPGRGEASCHKRWAQRDWTVPQPAEGYAQHRRAQTPRGYTPRARHAVSLTVRMRWSKKKRSAQSKLSSPLDDSPALQLPPTPPSSNHGDSDGSLPPSSPHLPLPPSSPQPQQRPGGRASSASSSSSSSAISSSPLLTAPHVSRTSRSCILLPSGCCSYLYICIGCGCTEWTEVKLPHKLSSIHHHSLPLWRASVIACWFLDPRMLWKNILPDHFV